LLNVVVVHNDAHLDAVGEGDDLGGAHCTKPGIQAKLFSLKAKGV